MVVLQDLFRGIVARRNSTKIEQSDRALRYAPKIKDERSRVTNGTPMRLDGQLRKWARSCKPCKKEF